MPPLAFRSPRTALQWSTLAEWYGAALALDRRRASALNSRRKELHVAALPLSLIAGCGDPAILTACRGLLRFGPPSFRQPLRGKRADAPPTALIVAIENRLSRLARGRESRLHARRA